MRSGPFARRRQAKKDDKELGHGLWRQAHDRFQRSLDRYWQIIETDHTGSGSEKLSLEERNGLIHAGNLLVEQAQRVRAVCVAARAHYGEQDMNIPAGASEIHRGLSKAANDLATTAQAAAMFRQGQTDVLTIGRRAQRVLDAVETTEKALHQ